MLGLTIITMSIVCHRLCSTLKTYYPNFYLKQRCFIISMTVGLVTSCSIRLANIIWRAVILGSFNQTLMQSGLNNDYLMPLYYCLHFLTIDFLCAGVMLLNFGFALNNRTNKVEERRELGQDPKKRKRRETFLDLGDSDSEEEARSGSIYYTTVGTEGS